MKRQIVLSLDYYQTSPLQKNYTVNPYRESLSTLTECLYGKETSINVILKFITIRRTFSSAQSQRIYSRTQSAMLQEHIYQNRRDLSTDDRKLLSVISTFSTKSERGNMAIL